jgi:hypothetical protein
MVIRLNNILPELYETRKFPPSTQGLFTESGPVVYECSQRLITLFFICVILLFHVASSVSALLLKFRERFSLSHECDFPRPSRSPLFDRLNNS